MIIDVHQGSFSPVSLPMVCAVSLHSKPNSHAVPSFREPNLSAPPTRRVEPHHAAAVAAPAGNGYTALPNDLAGVEQMCEELYTAQDSNIRRRAESVLLSLSTSTTHLPKCLTILDNSSVRAHPSTDFRFGFHPSPPFFWSQIRLVCELLTVCLPISIIPFCTDAVRPEIRRMDPDKARYKSLGAGFEGGARPAPPLCLELSRQEGASVTIVCRYGAQRSVVPRY